MNLALKYDTPVIPMHVHGRNSWLYYLFYFLHEELRDMTLFRELFNKSGQTYRITIGEAFRLPGAARPTSSGDLEALTEGLAGSSWPRAMPSGASEGSKAARLSRSRNGKELTEPSRRRS